MARPSSRLLALFGADGRPTREALAGQAAASAEPMPSHASASDEAAADRASLASTAPSSTDTGGSVSGHEPRPYTVSQLLGALGLHVARFHAEIRQSRVDVIGEVTEVRTRQTGHVHFALKDAGGRLPCILYASAAHRLRFALDEGLEVKLSGQIKLYRPKMEVQLVVDKVVPVGQGALALAFEQRKAKLAAEGLFAPEHKKRPPLLPQCIGVVTSPDAAALRDVLKVLWTRMPQASVVLAKTRVQGEGAAAEIAAALTHLDAHGHCDVILLTRGGGSMEDLWAFNEPEVAYAVFRAQTPVISGIGHETDTTLADGVADVRAATPSQAAAFAVPETQVLGRRLDDLDTRMRERLLTSTQRAKLRLAHATQAMKDPRWVMVPAARRLKDLEQRLSRVTASRGKREQDNLRKLEQRLWQLSPEKQLQQRRQRVAALAPRLDAAIAAKRAEHRQALSVLVAQLSSLSPLAVLERGYALVLRDESARGREGALVKSAGSLQPGDLVRMRFADGSVRAQVDTVDEVRHDTPNLPAEE